MPAGLKVYYQQDLENYMTEITRAEVHRALRQFESAHI